MYQYVLPITVALILYAYLFAKPHYKQFRRYQITRQPFPTSWRKILKRTMPYYHTLPTDLQLQLKKHIQVFIAEKDFIGCEGITINDEIKVTIAAQACLLLLNRKTDYYPKLGSIAVYPSAFIRTQQQQHQIDNLTIVHPHQPVLLGESQDFGRVVLSWQHTLEGAKDPHDGSNLVIHEFAHQLDQETGIANGAPQLNKKASYHCWSKVLEHEFEQLKAQKSRGEPTLLDKYGATNPAEFFAVASEVFFERSNELYQNHRALYQQLKGFYQVDPINWH